MNSIPNTKTLTKDTLTKPLKSKSRARWVAQLAKSQLLKRLARLQTGQLTLIDGQQQYVFGDMFGDNGATAIQATITVQDPRFYGEIAFGGSIGAGEAYMLGYWQADSLTDVVRLMVLNQAMMDTLEGGYQYLSKPLLKVFHWLNSNSEAGSQKNIASHYDLGNELFQLFLDPTMMYSSAVFEPETRTVADTDSLQAASERKLKLICEKLQLSATDHVLEIGTGWGGFAIYAARHYGCQVTTTTISEQQFVLAKQRVAAAGLQDKIALLKQDYRHLQGQYDKLVSIEMIEAVGHQYYDTYFKKVSQLLKADGVALIQAITITDQRYESAIRSVDFIQRYIFPGSNIPSNTALLASMTRASDLRLVDMQDIGLHYATTLRLWRENFFAHIAAVRQLGYSETFIRMWDFYLSYCEGGFAECALGDAQLLLAKPGYRTLKRV
jgi:cyclopropane-fatty-acyl-phospholipid synthase